MIVADTSAVVTILKREPEHEIFVNVIAAADACLMSAVGYLEASMVMVGRGNADVIAEFDTLLRNLNILIVPFDERQARQGQSAFLRYGRGRHPLATASPMRWRNRATCHCCSRAVISRRPTSFRRWSDAAPRR